MIAGQLHLYSAADGDMVYCHGITGQNIGAFHRRAAAFQAVLFQEAVVVDIAVEPLSQIDVPALRGVAVSAPVFVADREAVSIAGVYGFESTQCVIDGHPGKGQGEAVPVGKMHHAGGVLVFKHVFDIVLSRFRLVIAADFTVAQHKSALDRLRTRKAVRRVGIGGLPQGINHIFRHKKESPLSHMS